MLRQALTQMRGEAVKKTCGYMHGRRPQNGLTILQSFPVPRSTTNPYLVMLQRALQAEPGTEVLNFTWRTALLGAYDVFHVHWPEILVNGHSPVKKLVRQILTLALLFRLRLTRTPIVRTVHNIESPQGITKREKVLLSLIERETASRIRLNATTKLPEGRTATIPHGDYRSWFAQFPKSPVIEGRIAYVGLIRRYKGVERLIEAFRGTQGLAEGLSLSVGGHPSTPELGRHVGQLALSDPRISLDLAFLSDEELVKAVTAAELVVLPYRFMHNSGGVLMALSLNRPVLVPLNKVNRMLSEEVGPGWVFTYLGDLKASDLLSTLRQIKMNAPRPEPCFAGREWAETAREHGRAYRAAVEAKRQGTNKLGTSSIPPAATFGEEAAAS
ncbi:glycosyl transferase [Arthrobacter sp. UYEF3]|uniref:glycosyl transferase n=1 Tax=Arthrobacter sp. UYEF3 TaxID=1756365 RepID=UPI0033927210